MILKINKNTCIVFDLDDTLYDEIEYLKSAYRAIINQYVYSDNEKEIAYNKMIEWYENKENVFKNLISNFVLSNHNINLHDLIDNYRSHIPVIKTRNGVREFINKLKVIGCKIGIISDGRAQSQRNKIKALGLEGVFDLVVISEEFGSEKPAEINYKIFHDNFPNKKYVYIADNVYKDFITPNKLGWVTICIKDKGKNIHKQNFDLPYIYLPRSIVDGFDNIKLEVIL